MRKAASTVPADPHGKRQHVVETLNSIDKGTSVLVAHHVRSDFTAETALQALVETFSSHGLPVSITLDRDTRLRLEHHKEATSLLLLCAFVIPLGLPCASAIRITPNKMGSWNALTARSIRNASCDIVPRPWMRSVR